MRALDGSQGCERRETYARSPGRPGRCLFWEPDVFILLVENHRQPRLLRALPPPHPPVTLRPLRKVSPPPPLFSVGRALPSESFSKPAAAAVAAAAAAAAVAAVVCGCYYDTRKVIWSLRMNHPRGSRRPISFTSAHVSYIPYTQQYEQIMYESKYKVSPFVRDPFGIYVQYHGGLQ